MLLAELTLAIG